MFTEKNSYSAFSGDMLTLAGFVDLSSLKTSQAKNNLWHTFTQRSDREKKYSLDWFLRICPWEKNKTKKS